MVHWEKTLSGQGEDSIDRVGGQCCKANNSVENVNKNTVIKKRRVQGACVCVGGRFHSGRHATTWLNN